MNKKESIVIAGSAKNQEQINNLINNLKNNYKIFDYPKSISEEEFKNNYINIFKAFFKNIIKTDIFLLFNYDKNNISGYIGAESFAEIVLR